MSCFILANERLTTLAKAVYAIQAHGFNYCRLSGSPELFRALRPYIMQYGDNPHAVFNALSEANAAAYCKRYADQGAPDPCEYDEKAPDLMHQAQYTKENNLIITPEHYQLLKLIECYLYQLNEDGGPETSLYKGMEILKNDMQHLIISSAPEYIAARWG